MQNKPSHIIFIKFTMKINCNNDNVIISYVPQFIDI